MHEMLARSHPFKGVTRKNTLRNMCTGKPNIDSGISRNAQSLLRGLLRNNSRESVSNRSVYNEFGRTSSYSPQRLRLGCGPTGIQEIKFHPFFHDLDWDKVFEKGYEAPYIPVKNGPEDTRHFASYYTNEKIPSHENHEKKANMFNIFKNKKEAIDKIEQNNSKMKTEAEITKLNELIRSNNAKEDDEFIGFTYVDPATFLNQEEDIC